MYDCITIGDAMEDIFLFPSLDDMEKPVTDKKIKSDEGFEKYLVFGLGDKITVSDVKYRVGGTACNVAASISKLGLKSAIIAAIGDDHFGQDVKSQLVTNKVATSLMKIYKQEKTSFSVIVSYKAERTIFVYHGFSPEKFHLPERFDTRWVYLGPMAQGFEHLYNKITSQVIKKDLKVVVNPGAIQINKGLHSFGGLLKLISVIFLNRQEAQGLSSLPGLPPIKDIAKVIQFQGPKIVVITDGQNGAYAYNGINFYKVGIYPGHRIDATGAGDAFASAFLAGLMKGASLQECLKWGVVNSASVVGQIGAQGGLLSSVAIKRKIKEYRWSAASLRFS